MRVLGSALALLASSALIVGCAVVSSASLTPERVARTATSLAARTATAAAAVSRLLPPTPTRTVTPPATRTPTPSRTATTTRTPTVPFTPTATPTAALAKPDGGAIGNGVSYPIVRGPSAGNRMVLTFDMGTVNGSVGEVLDVLRANGVKATFFMEGKWAEANSEMVRTIVAAGHEPSNHSYTHPDFTKRSESAMVEELVRTEQAILRIAGVSTLPYWRPPFGAYDETVLRVVHKAGYKTVYWTLDSSDWLEESTAASVAARVLKYAEPGAIVVMHGASPKTAGALPQIIPPLLARGFRFVTMSGLFAPVPALGATPTPATTRPAGR